MKVGFDKIRMAETQSVSIREYLDLADDDTNEYRVTIRHYTKAERSEILALVAEAQVENKPDAGWLNSLSTKELLYGVRVDDSFPFEEWNEAFIERMDERNPALVQFLLRHVRKLNLPLA